MRQSTYESKRKGYTPQKITLFMAQFIVLATNLSATDCAKEMIAEAYRWRWQIEREFRRFKSTTYIRKLVNQKDSTVEVYILASMVAWLLSYKIAQQKSFFSLGLSIGKKAIDWGMVNIDALLKHIYESLRSALRDGVSMHSLFEFLKNHTSKFFRQKRKRKYAMPPPIKVTNDMKPLQRHYKIA